MNSPKHVNPNKFDIVEDYHVIESAFLAPSVVFQGTPSSDSFWTAEQFDDLLRWAIRELNISDVEIEENRPPYIKYNGKWYMSCRRIISSIDAEMFVHHISKNRTAATTARSGEPLDFRFQVEMSRDVYKRFRCNVTSKIMANGEMALSIVMRAISDTLPTVRDVGLREDELTNALPSSGLVAFSGPMGSGKTSTLAAIVNFRRETWPHESIGEYANPVEYDYTACHGYGPLWQVEIPQGLPNMRAAAANMARRSPNVIIIGESRDRDSFQAVLDTANMSVCLYTTLHANDVPNTISRIVNAMPEETQNTAMGTLIELARYFMHQRLIEGNPFPDGRARRVPLRESLLFSSTMKMELMSINNLNLIICQIHQYLEASGRSLLKDATEKYENGLIPLKALRLVQSEFQERVKVIEKTYDQEQKRRMF